MGAIAKLTLKTGFLRSDIPVMMGATELGETTMKRMYPPRLSTDELRDELTELLRIQREAGHAPSSLETQRSHTELFLNWLDGKYAPRKKLDIDKLAKEYELGPSS